MAEGKILCVGLACVDILSMCTAFPEEDSDERCSSQWWQCGGNASNSCTVLARLGARCEWFGTIAKSFTTSFISEHFSGLGIDFSHAVYHGNCTPPTAVVLINQQNGSRTILHTAKDLPELSFSDFQTLNLNDYIWIHFEGRPNYDDLKKMLDCVNEHNNRLTDGYAKIRISLEVEKCRPDICPLELAGLADYVFVSKDHARHHGYSDMHSTLQALIHKCRPGGTLICPWGELGAMATNTSNHTVSSPAFCPPHVVDTCAAGDTFNAATILALSRGHDLEAAIKLGCRIAGVKCGMKGFDGISDLKDAISCNGI